MQQLADKFYPEDTKLFYRDADETICVVSDEQDFYEARLQQRDSGNEIKLYAATDATSANLIIPYPAKPFLENSMVLRLLDNTIVSDYSQIVSLTDSQIEANV